MSAQSRLTLIVITLTILSGWCDSLGFTYAARIWQEGQLQWHNLARSALGFATGISLYWGTIRYFSALGIVSAELQTLLWFGTTMLGVALLSGKALYWRPIDQFVAVLVLIGIAWLFVHVEN
ncbi:MAG: hypothetical protein AB7G75_17390 [Candidatus Binatia bacterium]